MTHKKLTEYDTGKYCMGSKFQIPPSGIKDGKCLYCKGDVIDVVIIPAPVVDAAVAVMDAAQDTVDRWCGCCSMKGTGQCDDACPTYSQMKARDKYREVSNAE